jgi:hypothetical protein
MAPLLQVSELLVDPMDSEAKSYSSSFGLRISGRDLSIALSLSLCHLSVLQPSLPVRRIPQMSSPKNSGVHPTSTMYRTTPQTAMDSE